MKNKVIYESKVHTRDTFHDVLIIQEPKVNGVKLKMTYECYGEIERFIGELFIGGKWEHFFCLKDLGITSDKSMYIRHELQKNDRCKQLQELGVEFFNLLN
jgi:hypothetical protein